MGSLEGAVAVVTGAGRGLGYTIAEELGFGGAKVVVNYARSRELAEELAAKLSENGEDQAVAIGADVSDPGQAQRLIEETIGRYGRIDVLVNNAGIVIDRTMKRLTTEEWDKVVQVDLNSCYYTVKAALPYFMEQESGKIINISSFVGQAGNFGQTNYAAAKAGIVAMARTWALELARSDIAVNAVVPVAATEMTRTIPAFAPVIEEAERTGAPFPDWLRRDEGLGTVEDVASLIVFLASDAARRITGQAIGIGGDRLALWAHPREKAVAFADGGWTADAIAESWATGVGAEPETSGIPAPRPPEA